MKQIHRTYEIRLVTPAFLAGADQQAPELRVPSIRGSLRWWFRLAQHGAGAALEQIRAAESELFGSIDTGQRLILRIRPNSLIKPESTRYQDLPFDHKYLWFPLRPPKGSTASIVRPALSSGTVFRLDAIVPRGAKDGADVLKQLDAVVSHWVYFGSIGTRSRRCAGSLWFSSRLPSGDMSPMGRDGIQKTLEANRGWLPIDFVSPEAFDDWKKAINAVGNHYRGRRSQIKDSKGRKALPALGWPIMKYPGTKNNEIEVDGHESERLSSPVLLKVIPEQPRDPYIHVEDLLLNAERRAVQGRYDDAVARCYRAMELIAQVRLRKSYGIETADVDLEKVPSPVRNSLGRYRSDDGKIQLPLFAAWMLLSTIVNDPLGTWFEDNKGRVQDFLGSRNYSILAHGDKPIDEAIYCSKGMAGVSLCRDALKVILDRGRIASFSQLPKHLSVLELDA